MNLYLIRGLPSSGKSTLARKLNYWIDDACEIAADDYFYENDENEYRFDITKLHDAHEWCIKHVKYMMMDEIGNIFVHNTFTTEKEMKPYFDLAEKYGYTVTTLIVESRHDNKNDHNVAVETVNKMRNRFSIKL